VNRFCASLILVLAVVCGGGSLLLFSVFLVWRAPGFLRLGWSEPAVLGWDAGLSLLFFVQHSGMIRRPFRVRLESVVPSPYGPALYSIASGLALGAVVLLWQATPATLVALAGPWRLVPRAAAILAIGGFVWGVRALRVFDPFGRLALQAHLRGRPLPQLPLAARGPYQWVRHPLYSCMLVFFWSVPDISTDRLVFAVLWTAWVVVGATWEERDLVADFGESYRRYQQRVPMLLPWRGPAGRRLPAA
jgi:protein-S-isoprenylcysteine O-methyltransferase Ste14